jgi:hypothetical protein
MKLGHSLVALFGFPGMALAVNLDPKPTDAAYISMQFERSQVQAQEVLWLREAKRKEFLDRSQIGEAGDSCLAYALETGDCSISTAEFNQGLVSHLPDSLEYQSGESLALKAFKARQSVFEQLVDRVFMKAYGPENSRNALHSEGLNIETKSHEWCDGIDFPTLITAFPKIRAQVVASSDSAWLAAQFKKGRSGIQAITIQAWELPDSVTEFLAHFPRGAWTPILKAPFGFLACSWLDSLPSPEILAKIRPSIDAAGSKSRSKLHLQAIDSLRNHGEWCMEEDTLTLSLRLAPAIHWQAQESGPAWSNTHSSVLPASIKRALWMKFGHGTLDTLGPIRSVYGTWMLAPSSRHVKLGRMLDSTTCLARTEARIAKEERSEQIRSEWERVTSKVDADAIGEARTALLEDLLKQGGRPEYSYRKLREDWVARSLRITRDIGFPDALSRISD